MAKSFNIHDFTCEEALLPTVCWRVSHGNSQHTRDALTGTLTAAANNTSFVTSNRARLRQAVVDHLDWRSYVPSCFLSVFSEEQSAIRWASTLISGDVTITPVIIAMLSPDTLIFDVEELCEKLGIPNRYSRDEFLITDSLPYKSLGHRWPLQEGAAPLKDFGLLDDIEIIQRLNDQVQQRFSFVRGNSTAHTGRREVRCVGAARYDIHVGTGVSIRHF
ncbi:hypothetical protein B0J18DRAFT_293449 [Chaetomium sp. MPI-SDFR-AT-0129]|nr:hypothetical protein B0J18DRAFT_293449 [Chaetomium sp. MPI-SDFR-AT-0129]